MATFAVTREKIGALRPIEGADRIELATLKGMDFQFVVVKGRYQIDDDVIYIPVDSVLPTSLIETLGLVGRLCGPEMNRVKTVKLRGTPSQGLVTDAKTINLPDDVQDITAFLGITKYEAAPNDIKDGILMPRPDGQSAYDIESADRFTDIAARLMDELVEITEKLEGQNVWATAWPDDTVAFGIRDNTITLKDGVPNTVHRVLLDAGFLDKARAMARDFGKVVTVYGEFVGPGSNAGNYYDIKTPDVFVFEIRVGFIPLIPEEMTNCIQTYGFHKRAPVIATGVFLRDWLAGKTIKEASDGKSLLNPNKRREGIVIRPMRLIKDDRLTTVLLKQRGPLYLANSDF